MTIHEIFAPKDPSTVIRAALEFVRQRKKTDGRHPNSLAAAFFAIIERNLMDKLRFVDSSFKEKMDYDPELKFRILCEENGESSIDVYGYYYDTWCKQSLF